VVAGTAAVALILAFGRWGTNIGISPLFITDVLIALSLVNWLLTNSLKGARPLTGWASRSRPSTLFIVFMLFVVFRFLFSLGNGPILDWFRDAVPFLYGVLAFMSARSIATSTAETRSRSMRLLWWALSAHLVWTSIVVLTGNGQGFPIPGPFFSAPVFQIRPDIDAAIIAIAAGMLLRNFLLKRHRFWSLAGIALGSITVLNLGTRAGLISVVVALTLAFVLTFSSSERRHPRRIAMVFAVPFVIALAAVILPTTTPGQRLIATIDPTQVFSAQQQSAQGTQRARELTWSTVIDWTNADPARQLVGSGFGNDFLAESGTKAFLEGTTYTNVRSPHNWFVGIYARMGVIGLTFALAVVLQAALLIWRNRRRIGSDSLLSLSAVVVASILPVASLGVVLEAPFGAVPFFWALGIIHTIGWSGSKASETPAGPEANVSRPRPLEASQRLPLEEPHSGPLA
jgi:hypothetical protein